MRKKYFATIITIITVLCLVRSAHAASVYFKPENTAVHAGDVAIIDVMMNTEEKLVNVVEGTITVASGIENIKVTELGTAGAALTLWPRRPALIADLSSDISFTGGVPGGVKGKELLLFKIVYLAKSSGNVAFAAKKVSAYENDGKASPIDVSSESFSMMIAPAGQSAPVDAWRDIISKDNQPPTGLTAIISQDPSMYNNRKFLYISATDDQSGIDYFEVKEGSWPLVRTGSTYLLRDQERNLDVLVIAYDKAGNASRILLKPTFQAKRKSSWMILGGGLLILMIAIAIIWRNIKRKQKPKEHEPVELQ